MEQQRQLRLGDTLDDYCPRERRLTDHAVVAMVGPDVKQTRCTACDTEHEYKHGKVPRLRRKPDSPAALYGQVAAGAPKRVTPDPPEEAESPAHAAAMLPPPPPADDDEPSLDDPEREDDKDKEEGPVHRPLIRASLPRPEGQPPPARPIPEFTIRQPGGGRPGRFRPRHERGGGSQQFFGNRSNGNMGGGSQRGGGGQRPGGGPGGGRPPQGGDPSRRRHGPGRRRPK
ncbi:MAG: hypothetical protein WBD07_00540 [Vicinamibacterales bacterium]